MKATFEEIHGKITKIPLESIENFMHHFDEILTECEWNQKEYTIALLENSIKVLTEKLKPKE